MKTEDLLSRLHGVKSTASGWAARCPAHEDCNASLSVAEGRDGRILLNCFAGCSFDAICTALGVHKRELFQDDHPQPDRPRLVKTYDYTDPDGKTVFQVCRYEPKTFKQRRPDPSKPDGWAWDMRGVNRVLYRLPGVLEAVAAGRAVFIVEGEKDADTLAALGLCATCNAGGAGKWQPGYTAALAGAKVCIIPDKDGPGRNHAALIQAALTGKAAFVQVVELPDRNGRKVKDAFDWTAAGGTVEELREIVRTAQAWTPPTAPAVQVSTTGEKPAAGNPDIRARLWAIAQDKTKDATGRQRAIAEAVVSWLHERGRFYYHDERRDFAGVMYFDAGRKLLLPVQSDSFLAWLADALAMNRAERPFAFVQAAVETEGLSERSTGITPATYWAARETAFYLSNGPGRMVKIAAGGVEIVDNGTDGILFPQGETLAAWRLGNPIDPFQACSLFRDMSAMAGHGPDLFRLWVMSLPTGQRTKPPLVLSGTVGSGKTRLIRGVFELYGMPPRIAAVLKNGEGDFWAAVDGGGVACFDNADTRVDWLADALASAATDGSMEKRRLYTDAGRVQLRARSWVCITSASPSFAADAGLADRLLVVRLGRREGATAESALSDEIAANRDAGLSWIAEALARALADAGPVPPQLNARHPDFAALAVRIGRAIGREAEAVAALRAAEADKALFNLENDAIGTALLELLQAGPFDGPAADLVEALQGADPSLENHLSARRLGKWLAKKWPHLESLFGATSEKTRTGAWRYSFVPPAPHAEYAEFKSRFSEKSYARENIRTLSKTPSETMQTMQGGLFSDPKTPLEAEK